jgi:hypothetical protein
MDNDPNPEEIRRFAAIARERELQRRMRERELQNQRRESMQQHQQQQQQQSTTQNNMGEISEMRRLQEIRHRQYLENKEREDRERQIREDGERQIREERERLEREEREKHLREERERLEREERDKKEQEKREIHKLFFRELNNRRLQSNLVLINTLHLPPVYNINEILDKYIELCIIDNEQFSFYVGDAFNVLRSLELLYASPETEGKYDFIEFMKSNNIYWKVFNLEKISLNDIIMREINSIFFNYQEYVIENLNYLQYYLDLLRPAFNETIDSSIITDNYLPRHIKIIEILTPEQQNSFEINMFIADNIKNMDISDEDIFAEIVNKFFSQSGGYKKKFFKYINKNNKFTN